MALASIIHIGPMLSSYKSSRSLSHLLMSSCFNNTASAGARAYNEGPPPAGVQGRAPGGGRGERRFAPPEADDVFAFKTVIFNGFGCCFA